MGKITLRRRVQTVVVKGKKERIALLDNKDFEKFNPQLLSLGNIGLPSTQVEAIAAVFDLSGFTSFCSQVDPHLVVPEYLSRFLGWLFDEIKKQHLSRSYKEGKELYCALPFLAKFLGDGVLFLWDARNMSETAIRNVVISLDNICGSYTNDFYPRIKTEVVAPPKVLRCGIARGKVFSVGNGQDYVGPCINIASRLQKLSQLTFCFSRRGIDMNKHSTESVRQSYLEKCVTILGIGDDELVLVRKTEFDNLPEEEKKLFREP